MYGSFTLHTDYFFQTTITPTRIFAKIQKKKKEKPPPPHNIPHRIEVGPLLGEISIQLNADPRRSVDPFLCMKSTCTVEEVPGEEGGMTRRDAAGRHIIDITVIAACKRGVCVCARRVDACFSTAGFRNAGWRLSSGGGGVGASGSLCKGDGQCR